MLTLPQARLLFLVFLLAVGVRLGEIDAKPIEAMREGDRGAVQALLGNFDAVVGAFG